MLRDDDEDEDEDEDLQRFLIVYCFNYKDSPPYERHYCCIDMLGHISEGENEQETIIITINGVCKKNFSTLLC